MRADKKIVEFLSEYNQQILTNALQLREVVISNLQDIIEQIDMPARMVAYCYGQKYTKMICTIIPSKHTSPKAQQQEHFLNKQITKNISSWYQEN